MQALIYFILALSLIVTGCATTNSNQTTDNTKTIIKKPIENKNITQREELVNVLVQKIAIKDYINMAKELSKDDKEFVACLNSDKTYQKANLVLKNKISDIIKPLNDKDVERYLILKNNSKSHIYQKYYDILLDTTKLQIVGKKVNLQAQHSKLGNLWKKYEFADYFDILTLPNKEVKSILFPFIDGNENLELLHNLKQTLETTCSTN